MNHEDFDFTEKVGDYQLNSKLKMEKVKNVLKAVVNFFLWSSVNSNKISLTLKSGIPFLILLGISDTETLEALTGSIGQFIALTAQLVTGAVTIYALIRKIWFSME